MTSKQEWPKQRLGEVADLCLGKMLDKKKNRGELHHYLGNIHVRWGRFDLEDLPKMRFEEHEHERYGLKRGDLVVCEGGEPGRCALWNDQVPNMKIQKALHRVRPHECLDSRYLFYWFLWAGQRSYFDQFFTGATIKHLPGEKLAKVEVDVPDLHTQHRIAGILSAYDDLIENNLLRIRILEKMAQFLYHEWFVHFRYPGHESTTLVESPLGPIPDGWEVKPLGDVAGVNSTSIKKNSAPDQIHYIDIKSVTAGTVGETSNLPFSEAPSRARRIVSHGDVIWATVRPNLRAFALIIDPPENTIASTGFAVLTAKQVPFGYLYLATTTQDFTTYLVNHTSGAAYPAVNAGVFEQAKILIPSPKVLERFNAFVEPSLLLQAKMRRRNETLRQTRDLLLPKLLSPRS